MSGGQHEVVARAAPTSSLPPVVASALGVVGQPLEASTRAELEPRLGYDLSHVRVHADGRADVSARMMQASAYTVGRDIVFASGRYEPRSGPGRSLLVHELAHVIQQGRRTGAHGGSSDLEAYAGDVASAYSRGARAIDVLGASPMRIAREGAPAVPSDLSRVLTSADMVKLGAFGPQTLNQSLDSIRSMMRKTGGLTQGGRAYPDVQRRQATGEMRALFDALADPTVTGVVALPSSSGGVSPDFAVQRGAGTPLSRLEVSNVTLARQGARPTVSTDASGATTRRIPKDASGKAVQPSVTDFNEGIIRDQVRGKINHGQLSSQNPNTTVAGQQIPRGGVIRVSVEHGDVDPAALDRIIQNDLKAELAGSPETTAVEVDAFDASNPNGGRVIFRYERQTTAGNTTYTRSVRRSFAQQPAAPAAPATPPPVAAPAAKPSGGDTEPPSATPAPPVKASGDEAPVTPVKPVAPAAADSGAGVAVKPASPVKPDDAEAGATAKPVAPVKPADGEAGTAAKPAVPMKPADHEAGAPAKPTSPARPSGGDEPAAAPGARVAPKAEPETPAPSGGGALKGLAHAGATAGADIVMSIIDSKLQEMRRNSDFQKMATDIAPRITVLYSQLLELQSKEPDAKGYALVQYTEAVFHVDTPDNGGVISDQYNGISNVGVSFTTTGLDGVVSGKPYKVDPDNKVLAVLHQFSPEYTEYTDSKYTIDLGRFTDEQLRDYLKARIETASESDKAELQKRLDRIEGRIRYQQEVEFVATLKRREAERQYAKAEKARVKKVIQADDEKSKQPAQPVKLKPSSLEMEQPAAPPQFLPNTPVESTDVTAMKDRVDRIHGRRDWLVERARQLRDWESKGIDPRSDAYKKSYAEYKSWRDAWITALQSAYKDVPGSGPTYEAHQTLDNLMGWYTGDGQRILAEVTEP